MLKSHRLLRNGVPLFPPCPNQQPFLPQDPNTSEPFFPYLTRYAGSPIKLYTAGKYSKPVVGS